MRNRSAPRARVYQRFYGLDLAARNVPAASCCVPSRCAGSRWWGRRVAPQPVATMFMFHGFYDHMGLYRHVVDWALDQGFVVIACDLPGHGLSSGARASIDDFAVYQEVVQALFAQAASAATAAALASVRAEHRRRGGGGSLAQPGRRQPGPGQDFSAVTIGAAACVGLVAGQLLPAAAVRQRHRPAVQREHQ